MPHAPAAPLALRVLRLALALALVLALVPALTARAQGFTHIVQPGENLFRIGLRYGVSWQAIMAANGLTSTYIYVGEVLVIPGVVGDSTPAIPPAPEIAPTPDASLDATPAADTPATAGVPAAGGAAYTVQPGDTLFLIALRNHLTVAALMQVNYLANPNLIYAGQTLTLPAGETLPNGQTLPAAPAAATGRWLNVIGYNPLLSLDCEARSAADWAGYFGFYINELEFFHALPVSDDPDTGFVGAVQGVWGQTPPNAYGVNAGPVAALLRAYGVGARAVSGLDWDTVRAEIDQDRPVIAWVVGHVAYGRGFAYTAASNGHTTLVAPYEHTVIVTGYGPNAATVTVLDDGMIYSRPLGQFLASWSALGYQAILAQ